MGQIIQSNIQNDRQKVMTLRFDAVPSRGYAIESSADLAEWQIQSTLTATRPDMEVAVPTPSSTTRRFLRVRALP
jgi:hypothetical protein